MKIVPSPLSISQLFSSNNEQFYVPAYQRRFAWEKKQLGELFDDIKLLQNNDSHLLGTILFLSEQHVAGINQIELVDGQQRITSLILLLKAIQDIFKEKNQDDFASEINNYIFCKGVDRKEKNKLLLGDLDNPDFVKLLEYTDVDDIINFNITNAYSWFKEWLANVDDLNLFYYKLINNLIVIRLDVGQAKDAYKLFETINNRGLRLSPTDIIKNFLLGHASMISEETLNKVRNYWKSLIVNLDGISTDDFFRQFLSGTLGRKISFSRLVDEFKEYYLKNIIESELLSEYHIYKESQTQSEEVEEGVDMDILSDSKKTKSKVKKISLEDFAKKLKEASDVYARIINRTFDSIKINQKLFDLERIKSFPSYTFLLNLFQRNLVELDYLQILTIIQTFMLRRHICEYRTSEFDDIFSKLVEISDIDIVNQVRTSLQALLPDDEEFVRKFAKYNFKGNVDRAKYILEQFEYEVIEDKGEYTLNSGNALHLEHIIPQTIDTKKAKKEFGDWVTYLGDRALEMHKEYVNLIGNYTLLSGQLNIIASNNPFLAKKVEYKKSNIQLTLEIVRKYDSFKFQEVEERSKLFSKTAMSIWRF